MLEEKGGFVRHYIMKETRGAEGWVNWDGGGVGGGVAVKGGEDFEESLALVNTSLDNLPPGVAAAAALSIMGPEHVITGKPFWGTAC